MSTRSSDSLQSHAVRQGWIAGLIAYFSWGVFPIYWKQITFAAPLEQVSHRVVWTLVFCGIWLLIRRELSGLALLWRQPRLLATMSACTVLLAANWLVFIYAIATKQVIAASLGYFINPIVNVVFGLVFLGERLTRLQWLAVSACVLGVSQLVWAAGELPWISLFLAASFGLYGLIRKRVQVAPLVGSMAESCILAPFALGYLVWLELQGTGAFGQANAWRATLLVSSGWVTGLPLVCFGVAVRNLPLSTVGFLQYLAPSLQLTIAVLVYDEPFTAGYRRCFALLWPALIVFVIDQVMQARGRARIRTAALGPSAKAS